MIKLKPGLRAGRWLGHLGDGRDSGGPIRQENLTMLATGLADAGHDSGLVVQRVVNDDEVPVA